MTHDKIKKNKGKKMAEDKKKTKSVKKEKLVKHEKKSKPSVSRDDKQWGMFVHLAAFAGYVVPFGNIIGPLILWLIKRVDSPFVDAQGKEALNFQISITIYIFISVLLMFVLIGFILVPLLILLQIVFIVVAAIRAQDGEVYHYPLAMRFFK